MRVERSLFNSSCNKGGSCDFACAAARQSQHCTQVHRNAIFTGKQITSMCSSMVLEELIADHSTTGN